MIYMVNLKIGGQMILWQNLKPKINVSLINTVNSIIQKLENW